MLRRVLTILFAAVTLAACGGGNSPPPPPPPAMAAITTQPTDQSVVAGTPATFSVAATSATGYQWQRSSNGGASFADVAGATGTSHTTAATALADSGTQYRVVVAGSANSVTSSAAALTVTATAVAPAITVQPAARAVTEGQNASFSVTATGTAPSYQWQRSTDGGAVFADEPGASAATLDLAAVPLTHNGHLFRVLISNVAGSVTSSAALLTVNVPTSAPVFTTQPVSVSVTDGQGTQFSVAVSGVPAPTLEWQVSVNGGPWAGFGLTTPVYTINIASLADNGRQYRVVATNSAGTTVSDVVLLTVTAAATAPVFTTHPSSVTITAGQSTQFTVAASGSPTPTFQWQLSTDGGANWSNIVGQTGAVFDVINAAQGNNGRRFRAAASNAAGSATSSAAVLTVNPPRMFQFNLFGFNAGPASFLLYGGSVEDGAGTIQCSGDAGLADPCPKWRADYPEGTVLTLTAKPWTNFRVSGWVGGDCGSPGTASTATLTIAHNSNCHPLFEPVPGATFSVSAVPAGPWIGLVVEVVSVFGNLVVPDTPRISCGPLTGPQICATNVDVAASPFTMLRLKAVPLLAAPVGQVRWTCSSISPDGISPVVRTVTSADIALGPIHSNTACSAELIP
jgi:predicted secreted protein